MARDVEAVAHTIAQIAGEYPQRSALAFDADGKLIDWQETDDGPWVNGAHAGERIFVVGGGASESDVRSQVAESGDR
ncbi:hypothetical protein [Williamsia maris]|uniref:Uncharacterized protein n=1 Tax=Williamsia maris TaxID=72806 RepID=A0ABT1HD21_9NOCA|nr:hypothetical protein [Williamsia maris]MCP2176155.1 hypothetical protein [Williamsia maris]